MSHISCSSCGRSHLRLHDCSCHCKSCGGSHSRDFIRDIRFKRNKIQHEVICFDSHNDCHHHSRNHCNSHSFKPDHYGTSYYCSQCHKHRDHCSCQINQEYHHFHHSSFEQSSSCSACGKRPDYCSCGHNHGFHHSHHVSTCDDKFKVRLGGLTTGIEFRLRQLTGCIVRIRISGGNGNGNGTGNTAEQGTNHLLAIRSGKRRHSSDNEITGRICLVGGNFVELDHVKHHYHNHHHKHDEHQVASHIIPINRINYVELLDNVHRDKHYHEKNKQHYGHY